MDQARRQKIEELYYAALERDSKDRAAFLNRYEPDVRREVEILLAQEGLPPDRPVWKFLPSSTVTVFAPGEQLGQATVPAADLFEARFLPGTILAQRYRVVNLLGRGWNGRSLSCN